VSTFDTCPNQNADSRKSSYCKEYVKIVYSVMGRKYLHCHVVTRRRRRPRAQRSIFRETEIVYNRTCRVGSDPKSVNGDKLPHTNFQQVMSPYPTTAHPTHPTFKCQAKPSVWRRGSFDHLHPRPPSASASRPSSPSTPSAPRRSSSSTLLLLHPKSSTSNQSRPPSRQQVS
jgi:hypothetical protein